MGLPCDLHDETDLEARILVGAAERVHDIEFLARQLLGSEFLQLLPGSLRNRLVVVLIFIGSPPDRILGGLVHYEELVLGRTAGINAGHHVHGTGLGQLAFFETAESLLGLLAEKFVVRRIVHDLGHARDPVLFQIHFVHNNCYFNKTSNPDLPNSNPNDRTLTAQR